MSSKLKPGGQIFTPEQYHILAKMKFIGANEHKLPNGRTIVIPENSSDLGVDEFSDFMMAVEEWAAEYGVYLPE